MCVLLSARDSTMYMVSGSDGVERPDMGSLKRIGPKPSRTALATTSVCDLYPL